MDQTQESIKTTKLDAGILNISLNRPQQLNALSKDVLMHLSSLLHQVKYDSSVRAILLTGEGKGFCAGADIKQLAALQGTSGLQFAQYGQAVFRELEMLGKPSLAAIHGFAFGGGCELAMAATLRIAATLTQFGQPEIKLGVIPGFGGTQRLARLIGKGRALEICLTGKRFNAEEALQWGLVTEVIAAEQLLNRGKELLTQLTSLSPQALQSIMTTINQGYDLSLEEGLALEAAHFSLCCTTADKKEGVSAFLEKRTPVFRGERNESIQ